MPDSTKGRNGSSLARARVAITVWDDTENDEWQEEGPLRDGLRGISAEDALVLLDEVKERFGSGTDHMLTDEIVAALLPEPVRERYWVMADGGAWWYA